LVAAQLEVLAEEKGQLLSTDVLMPIVAEADRVVLRQALINLLDNAIKHSPERAHIRVVVRDRSGTPVVEVIDTGPGIAPEHREAIFQRFYRIDHAPAKPAERGSGSASPAGP